ncbi:Epoxide hydrolase 4 [Amphibalanus amphitrite]|uniref:Epoxide hydrolase 4 n=1 Tax=Amphibalanus amphitrite TaxID=1232801 RepID=A0A6A4V2X0_AMPAM|nr:Epoxide hydrolase 4 [Amphibalanus amphitrite]
MVQVVGPVRGAVAALLAAFWSGVFLLLLAVRRVTRGPEALQPRRRPRPALLDDPALGTHKFATVFGGIKLHYVEKGDRSKPLLLLLHGFPAFWFCWHYQLKALSQHYWVVAVDMRGYGESAKPEGRDSYDRQLVAQDLFHLVLSLGRQSCTVIGHDWGGIIAYELARLRSSLVEKLIIINAPHPDAMEEVLQHSWDQMFRSWYIYLFQLPWLPEQVMQLDDFNMFTKMFHENPSARHHYPPEMVDAYKYTFGEPGALTPPLNYYRQSFGWRWHRGEPAQVARVTCPLLVIWGERDRALSPLLATMAARYADRFSVHLLPNASHWAMMEEPEEVNEAIRSFISGQ